MNPVLPLLPSSVVAAVVAAGVAGLSVEVDWPPALLGRWVSPRWEGTGTQVCCDSLSGWMLEGADQGGVGRGNKGLKGGLGVRGECVGD